jgi:subtilase family serine protease
MISKQVLHQPIGRQLFLPMLLCVAAPMIPSQALATEYTPATIRQAYGFNLLSANYTSGVTGSGQTIAIIDAYGATNINSDVNSFDSTYGLPALTSGSNFNVMSQTGTSTLPAYNAGWAEETTLDVEYAHAIAPGATIDLVEASSASYSSLFAAATYAAAHGASVVSMSFGGGETTGTDSVFNQPGVTFVASSGDSGSSTGVSSPASSQYVIGVGGTSLTTVGGVYSGETAWSGSGGGMSTVESRPGYQDGVQILQNGVEVTPTNRVVPDVAYDADPNTGVAVIFNGQSVQLGGTSIGAPQWAGLFALADQERAANGLPLLSSLSALQAMYATYGTAAYSMAFHDITSGSNGSFSAATGYDEVTGLGSPIANELVPYLGGEITLGPLAVPEPASIAFFSIALPFLLLPRRNRRAGTLLHGC